MIPRRKSKITTFDDIASTPITPAPHDAFDAYNTAVEASALYNILYIIHTHIYYVYTNTATLLDISVYIVLSSHSIKVTMND